MDFANYTVRSLLAYGHRTAVLVCTGTRIDMVQKYKPVREYMRTTSASLPPLFMFHVPTEGRNENFARIVYRAGAKRFVLDLGDVQLVLEHAQTVLENATIFSTEKRTTPRVPPEAYCGPDYAGLETRMMEHYREEGETLAEAMKRVLYGGAPLVTAMQGKTQEEVDAQNERWRRAYGPVGEAIANEPNLCGEVPAVPTPKAAESPRCECGSGSVGLTHASYCPLSK